MDYLNSQPIYLQIVDVFCANILSKEWVENQKIPSVRDTAVEMEVNPNTAIRVYAFLQDREIIYNKRGIGYFVAPNGYEKVLKMRRDDFFNIELPKILKTMVLLNVDCKELEQSFQIYLTTLSNK